MTDEQIKTGPGDEGPRLPPLPERDITLNNEKPTAVGCVLTLLTVAVIFGTALPIVQWRDPETGRSLPRIIAIFTPFLIAAVFHGICLGVLRLLGLPVWRKAEGSPAPPDK
jgi:hypothetical protein